MSNTFYFKNDNELYHFGILGMKWGVRRYQNTDGSLTPAGKKRYGDESYSSSNQPKNKNVVQSHKEKLIEKYKSKGYSDTAAETAAKQRMLTEIVVGSVTTVAVAVIAKKAVTRIGQDYCDKVIKSGGLIQNINANANETFSDNPFYAAINKNDKKQYGNLFPHEKVSMVMEKNSSMDYPSVYNNTIKVTNNIKRASVNNARKILYKEMESNPEFKNSAFEALKKTMYGGSDISNLKLYYNNPKEFYFRFNQALATPEFQEKGINKQFYSALQKKGYNALLDLNDARYSGYSPYVSEPTIFFGKDVVQKIASRKLEEAEINDNYATQLGKDIFQTFVKKATKFGLASVALNTVSDDLLVESYLKKHPNSNLSKKEILKWYDKQ